MAAFSIAVVANSGLTFPWAELTDTTSKSDANWDTEEPRVTMQMIINDSDQETAIKQILGFSSVVGNAGAQKLSRQLPWQHPRFYYLRAKRITSLKRWQPYGQAIAHTFNAAAFQYASLTIEFSSFPFRFLTDGQAQGKEYLRYVEKRYKPAAKILTSDRGQWQFNDTNSPSNGVAIRGSIGYPITDGIVEFRWYQVPENWLFNANGVPTKLNAAINTINNNTFPPAVGGVKGYPTGTLLLDVPDIIPVTQPINPRDMGFDDNLPARCYDVVLPCRYIDPPTNGATPGQDGLAPSRGHNLAPDPKSPTGQWYTISAISGGRNLFNGSDFTAIFKQAT